jgi:hypothetical protein
MVINVSEEPAALQIEAAFSSETSLANYKTKRCPNAEDQNLNVHSCEKRKSHMNKHIPLHFRMSARSLNS